MNGPITIADQMQASLNTTNNHNPELANLLQQLLAEIKSLNAKIPAAQVAAIAEEAQQLQAESLRPEPRRRLYQAHIDGITEEAQKLGQGGKPVLALAAQVTALLKL